MQTRKFDELISYFNRKVADMSIDTKYKMELLGMVTALGLAHEKELTAQTEQHWIPVTVRLPEEDDYRPCYGYEDGAVWWRNDMGLMGLGWYYPSTGKWAYYDESDRCDKCVGNVVEWMPLPKPWEGDAE